MRYINHAALKNIMLIQKPYRGSTNRFPLVGRTQSYKHFLREEDAEGEYMRVILGKRFKSEDATEEEYKADPEHVRKYKKPGDPQGYFYVKYSTIPNEIGIVRADNSFTFTSEGYGQGDRTQMSNLSLGIFRTDCRRGGTIFSTREGRMLPIFEGMKVDCNTMQPDPSHQYRLVGRRVNRKKSKEFLSQYEEFFKVSEVMMKNVSTETFTEVALENINRVAKGSVNRYWIEGDAAYSVISEARKLMNDSPLDAAAMFCCALGRNGINEFWWRIKNQYRSDHMDLASMYVSMRHQVCNLLYKEHPELFTEVEYEFGKFYPASVWGYVVEVDGKAVKQYD